MMNTVTVSAVLLTILASCTAAVNDYHSTTALNSSGATCPPWYSYDPPSGQCSFIHQLPQIVRQYGNSTELEMGFCMTVTNTSIVISQCPTLPSPTSVIFTAMCIKCCLKSWMRSTVHCVDHSTGEGCSAVSVRRAMALLHTDTLDSCVSNAPIQH